MGHLVKRLLIVLILMSTRCPVYSITPSSIAVVVNTNSLLDGKSEAVGKYYCAVAGIPSSNIIEVWTPESEDITQNQYLALAAQVRSKLISQFGVNPSDAANDKIQVLLMCYGFPHKIAGDPNGLTGETTSVDSFLATLFSRDPDLGPGIIDGDCNSPNYSPGTKGVPNPYLDRNVDFATFRASTDNHFSYTYGGQSYTGKLRYLVCRLDAITEPLVNVPGFGTMPRDVRDMIDQAHSSAGQTGRYVVSHLVVA